MGRPGPGPLILDAGALISFDRRDRQINVLIQRAKDYEDPILVPAGALAQAWRDGSRQARLAALIGNRNVMVASLTSGHAKGAGELCGRRQTADVIDASIVILARESRGRVATSDPDDLRHLDPGLDLIEV